MRQTDSVYGSADSWFRRVILRVGDSQKAWGTTPFRHTEPRIAAL